MTKKIVIKMQANSDKDISKVMKIASDIDGVISVSKKGEDQVVIVGDGIDSVKLTNKIRKKVSRYACLESLAEVNPEDKVPTNELALPPYIQNYPAHYYMYQPVSDTYPPNCYIM